MFRINTETITFSPCSIKQLTTLAEDKSKFLALVYKENALTKMTNFLTPFKIEKKEENLLIIYIKSGRYHYYLAFETGLAPNTVKFYIYSDLFLSLFFSAIIILFAAALTDIQTTEAVIFFSCFFGAIYYFFCGYSQKKIQQRFLSNYDNFIKEGDQSKPIIDLPGKMIHNVGETGNEVTKNTAPPTTFQGKHLRNGLRRTANNTNKCGE